MAAVEYTGQRAIPDRPRARSRARARDATVRACSDRGVGSLPIKIFHAYGGVQYTTTRHHAHASHRPLLAEVGSSSPCSQNCRRRVRPVSDIGLVRAYAQVAGHGAGRGSWRAASWDSLKDGERAAPTEDPPLVAPRLEPPEALALATIALARLVVLALLAVSSSANMSPVRGGAHRDRALHRVAGQGHPRRGRVDGHDRQAPRRSTSRTSRRTGASTARCSSRRRAWASTFPT